MKIYRLTKEERLQIFQAVTEVGLDPNDFRWSEHEELYAEFIELLHQPTEYSIRYTAHEDHARMIYRAQWVPAIERRTSQSFSSRNERLVRTKTWLDCVKREHDLPDLWAVVQQQRDAIVGDVVDEERRFTTDEQGRLAEQLGEVEALLVKIRPLTVEQATWVHLHFQFVTESSTRLTVKDWKNQFVGTLIQVAIALALEPNILRELFAFATRNVLPILGVIKVLLPSP